MKITVVQDELRDRNPGCPESARHTPAPAGYVAFNEWAANMSRNHVQEECPGCGRWEVWALKVARGYGLEDR